MQIIIGKNLFRIDRGNSKLDIRIPFIRIGKFNDDEGGYDAKFHVDLTTYVGYTSYDYGNSVTFMVLGFGFDYWWTDKLDVIEDDSD
ncbi:MAG: hypothetical protein EBU90_15810 [Proteobacteria bacterium]|nr:hypothetical protein [Pseudomonadota bacterium]